MKTIFHKLISEFIASSPEEATLEKLEKNYSGAFPDNTYISKCATQLSKILNSQLVRSEKSSSSKYFSNSKLSNSGESKKINITLQGAIMPSKGIPSGKNLDTMQILGGTIESVPFEIINKIVNFCLKSNASKITQMVPILDKQHGSTILMKLSTTKGMNLELRFNIGISSYEPILSNKNETLRNLEDLGSYTDKYVNFFDKLENYCREQLDKLGKGSQVDSKNAPAIKKAIYDLSVCKGKFKTFNKFVESCKSVTPGEWFKYCNSGESLSFLLSILDIPDVYINMVEIKYKFLNFPTTFTNKEAFSSKILSAISSLLVNVVKPQFHNILTSDIEKYKIISIGSQVDIPEQEHDQKNESLSLLEKSGAVSPETVKKHSNPDFIDKESTLTTIMYCLASTDLLYYLCNHYLNNQNSIYVIQEDADWNNINYFSFLSDSFKKVVMSYFQGGA